MARRIGRDDPEYQQAMREAKQQFEEAMAKSAMKGRGRPKATPAPAAPAAAAIELGELPDDALVDEVLADIPPEEEPVVAAPPAAAKKKTAPRARPAAKKSGKNGK